VGNKMIDLLVNIAYLPALFGLPTIVLMHILYVFEPEENKDGMGVSLTGWRAVAIVVIFFSSIFILETQITEASGAILDSYETLQNEGKEND